MNTFSKLLLAVTVSFSGLSQANNEVGFSKAVSVGGNGVTIRDTDSGWFVGGNVTFSERESFSESESAQSLSLIAGRRFYLGPKADVNRYYEGGFRVSHSFSDSDSTNYQITTVYGMEKYLSEMVSIEAAVGVGLYHYDGQYSNYTDLVAPIGKLAISYYFD